MLRLSALICMAVSASVLATMLAYRLMVDLRRLVTIIRRDTKDALHALYLFTPLPQLIRMLALPWLVTMVVLWGLLPLSLWCFVVPLSCVAPLWWLKRLRLIRARRFITQLPDMLALLSAGLKSGVPLLANFNMLANEVATPMREEIKVILRQLRLGQPLAEALDAWLERLPSRDLEQVILALKLGQHSGGQQARILGRLADTMRRKQQLQLKIVALTAQGRIQGKVMVALPLLIIVALYLIERPTMLALSQHPLGWFSLAVLMLLLAFGYFLVRQQVNVEIPL